MKKLILCLSIMATAATAMAYQGQNRSVSEGKFNYDRKSYYSNGAGHFCQHVRFDWNLRQLSNREVNLFKGMQNDGYCEQTFIDGQGPFNYRGRSFYKNPQGAYCEYRQFKPELKWISDSEARQVFEGAANQGYCGG